MGTDSLWFIWVVVFVGVCTSFYFVFLLVTGHNPIPTNKWVRRGFVWVVLAALALYLRQTLWGWVTGSAIWGLLNPYIPPLKTGIAAIFLMFLVAFLVAATYRFRHKLGTPKWLTWGVGSRIALATALVILYPVLYPSEFVWLRHAELWMQPVLTLLFIALFAALAHWSKWVLRAQFIALLLIVLCAIPGNPVTFRWQSMTHTGPYADENQTVNPKVDSCTASPYYVGGVKTAIIQTFTKRVVYDGRACSVKIYIEEGAVTITSPTGSVILKARESTPLPNDTTGFTPIGIAKGWLLVCPNRKIEPGAWRCLP